MGLVGLGLNIKKKKVREDSNLPKLHFSFW